jgi:hypothetical protein
MIERAWTIADGVNAATDEDELRFYMELRSLDPTAAGRLFRLAFGYAPPWLKRLGTLTPATPTEATRQWVDKAKREWFRRRYWREGGRNL